MFELKKRTLNHFKMLRDAACACSLSAQLDLETFQIKITGARGDFKLFPHFLTWADGYKHYTEDFSNDVRRFAGWRPYRTKCLMTFSDKIELKHYLLENSIRVPAYTLDTQESLTPVIRKRRLSSFSNQIDGPFRRPHDIQINPRKGEYFEQFIEGSIVKIWYWGVKPICIEMQIMPTITGNGKMTLLELIQARLAYAKLSVDYDKVESVLRYYDCSLATILAPKETQTVDFRYASALAAPGAVKELKFDEYDFDPYKYIEKIGQCVWPVLDKETAEPIVYTVDAIWDEQDNLWILELNTNPMIHPWLYEEMIRTFTGL